MQIATKRKLPDAITPGDFALTAENFQQIAGILHTETGIYLSPDKAPLVYSRLAKRIKALKLNTFSDYCALITSNDGRDELGNMLNALTTNVTRFLREPHHFETLKSEVLPPLIAKLKQGKKIRIWSAACSSGEEPYSIALAVNSLLPDAASYDIKILATDIDEKILARASAGVYGKSDIEILPESDRRKFFQKTDASGMSWAVNDELKQLITFRKLNLIKPWPMSGKFDAVFCRNVVIYFQEETQQELWSRFCTVIEPEGWLFIGHSERITGPAEGKFSTEGFTSFQRKI